MFTVLKASEGKMDALTNNEGCSLPDRWYLTLRGEWLANGKTEWYQVDSEFLNEPTRSERIGFFADAMKVICEQKESHR